MFFRYKITPLLSFYNTLKVYLFRNMALYTSGLFMALSALLFVTASLWNRRKTARIGYTSI